VAVTIPMDDDQITIGSYSDGQLFGFLGMLLPAHEVSEFFFRFFPSPLHPSLSSLSLPLLPSPSLPHS
jgi:hypothetical protein